jgi:uncharacterized repeat protein (TIGR01451 family)
MKMLNACSRSRLKFLLLAAASLPIFGLGSVALAADGGDLSPSALAQIQALQQEKASFTPVQQKMDSQLVFAIKQSRNELIANGAVPQLRIGVTNDSQGRVLVDLTANVTADLLKLIITGGGTNKDSVVDSVPQFNSIRAWIKLSQIENIAGSVDVKFIKPAVPSRTRTGSVDSEGDVTHRADTARSNFHVDGTGVKVGVLSDSVDHLAASQASGDLAVVTVLPGQSGVPANGEGTAMLEIVHDLAPGSDLFYATGGGGPARFAQNILDLRIAGCDIIVDDIFYFNESPFQDGVIAQAVNTVTAGGALYFSAAGNEGNLNRGTAGTWEGDFVDGGAAGAPVNGKNGNIHSFGATTYDTVTQPGFATILLWSDPLGSSTNDYDLYVLDSSGANVLSSSITTQNGTQDPFEMAFPQNSGERLVVVKASGDARFLHIDTIRGRLAIATAGNITGHAVAADAFAVAAVDANDSFPNPFIGGVTDPVESFSSDGPRRVFYNPDGTAITPGNFSVTGGLLRQKPDIAAADGVVTTLPPFSGLNPFFGTSAAAPHAAAVAALLKSFNPNLTPAQIRAVLTSSALDIMAPGVDRDSGAGIVMAFQALQASPQPVSAPRLVIATNILSGGNGNGIIDFDECNTMDLILTNAGSANASGVQATLSSTTPGVLIAQRFSLYADIPTNAAGTNLTSFKISTTPLFVCGTPVDFILTIKSDQLTATNIFRLITTSPGPVVRFDSSTIVPIPDANLAGTNSTIAVSNVTSAIFKVSVALNILHTFDADLSLQLIGPDGTTVNLSRNNGFSDNNYGIDCFSDLDRTVFDDGASNTITGASAPFVGLFKPEEALSAFIGKAGTNVNGSWNLHVVDAALIDVGTIQCWSLILQPSACVDGGGQCPGADLALGLKTTPDRGTIGSNLTYTISVTNNGPDTAKSVAVNQNLPASVIFVSASSSQGSVTHSGSTVSCNLGNLAVGASGTVTVVVLPTTPGTIFSTASVGAVQSDPNPSNNSITIGTLIEVPTADLAVALVGTPNPALLGGLLTYTVAVTNNGPSAAAGVVVSNLVPANTILVSAIPSQGTVSSSGNTVVASLGTVPKSGNASIIISVRPTALGSILAVSKVSAVQLDPLPANNTASFLTQVGPASDLLLTMTSLPSSIIVGSNITYQLTVLNLGPIAATGVNLNDTLPLNAGFVSATPSQGNYSISNNVVSCSLGSLGVGASATLSLVVSTASLPSVPVTLTNRAIVTADQPDPDTANNSASALTIVDNPTNRIVAAGSTLTAESFNPSNGAIDPGETVTVTLGLQNNGNINGGSLVATLLATNGVVTNSPQVQPYGVLQATAAPTFRSFTFTASGTNGGTITATLQLQDGVNTLPPVTFNFTLPTITRFANPTTITIPSIGAATPYPSTINVSGLSNAVGKVTVTVSNLNHTFSDDVAMLLVGPAGSGSQKVALMSHVGPQSGQSGVANATLTFDDSAAFALFPDSPIASGTYKPGTNGTVNWPTNTPAAPYGVALSVFNGTLANGTWSLYVYDGSEGDYGSISNGWSLAITTVKPVNQVADLSVTGTATPNPVIAGNPLTYTFNITNNGPNAASSVTFTNPLPAGATFVSASSFRGLATTNLNGAVYCNFTNSLAAGASSAITIVLTPKGGVPSLTSQAAVTATETDLSLVNNSSTVVTSVTTPQTDLALTLAGAPNPVIVGSNLTYTITVTNNGPDVALDVVVTNQLPAGLTFIPGSSASSFGLVTNMNGVITCNVGNLNSGNGGFITVATIPQQAGSITNRVGVRTDSSDTNLGNNSTSIVITATSPAPIILAAGATILTESQVPANRTIDPGETVTIALSLTNIGQLNAANLVATLQASGGVSSPSGPQNYGALIHGGAAVPRPFTFTFTGNGGNGGVVVATLQLQDGANNLGSVSFAFNLPATNAFANGAALVINASGPATPYASTINVSGLTGFVSKVTITLSNLSHAFPDDIDILLVSPSGRKTMVMSDVGGGHAITNVTLTLDDAAGAVLPDAGQLVAGTFLPTDYETGDVLSAPAPSGPYVASLAALNGGDPNGTWSLYVFDDSVGDSGSIASGWSLNIATLNPVGAVADLGITISNPAGQITAGSDFTYTLTVTNGGPGAASGVVVTDTLPAGLNYVSASAPPTILSLGGPVMLNFGNIPAGGSSSATLTVHAAVAGFYTNLVSVTGNEADLALANNSAQIATGVATFIPASLGSVTVHTNGSFTLILTGQPGQTYIVQASTNLVNWVPVNTNSASVIGKFQFTDSNVSSFKQRFYRAIRQSAP